MAYNKPGVEITQVQKSFSPTLISPDLSAVIIGPAYVVYDAEGTSAFNYGTYTASAATSVSFQGLSAGYLKVDATSVYVDLLHVSGLNAGNRLHLESTDLGSLTDGATSFTIASGVANGTSWNGAKILVGYRAINYHPDLIGGFHTIQSLNDIDSIFGTNSVVVENPLPFALSLAIANTGATVNAVALGYDEFASLNGSGTSTANENSRAMTIIAAQEVYAVAPLTVDATVISNYRAHMDTYSAATEKHERIGIFNPDITWYDSNSAVVTDPAAADKATTARMRRDATTAIGLKRSFYTFPDVAYFKVTNWPVQKLKQSYLGNLYGLGTTEYATLAKSYTLASGVTYKAGTPISDTVYAALKADTSFYQFDAYVPVDGTFMAACIAGQISGQQPEQGHTNLPIAGPSVLKYSNDFFSESQLNTIAQGGNYIMVNTGGTVSCRHQLSTDMTSIERRELNITKSVDFTAKYIRNTVAGYIGRSLITPAFLGVLGNIISGLGVTLVKEGHLNGFTLTSIAQDTVSKDTVLVSIEIQPKYPVNYIKIDLIF